MGLKRGMRDTAEPWWVWVVVAIVFILALIVGLWEALGYVREIRSAR